MCHSDLSENAEQCAFMDWIRLHADLEPYTIHIANQRRANLAYGALLKRMGVKAGVSDIFIARPNLGYAGCWIEFKRQDGGTISPAQREWLKRMQFAGYAAHVAHGCAEAIAIVKSYMGMA